MRCRAGFRVSVLFDIVVGHLKKKWLPEQITGMLKRMHPDQSAHWVSHETIYRTVAQCGLSQVTLTPLAVVSDGVLIKKIIKANNGKLLIQAIDIKYLLNMLSNPFESVGEQKQAV